MLVCEIRGVWKNTDQEMIHFVNLLTRGVNDHLLFWWLCFWKLINLRLIIFKVQMTVFSPQLLIDEIDTCHLYFFPPPRMQQLMNTYNQSSFSLKPLPQFTWAIFSSVSRSFWMVLVPQTHLSLVLSANLLRVPSIPLSLSMVEILSCAGPSMGPWETPIQKKAPMGKSQSASIVFP